MSGNKIQTFTKYSMNTNLHNPFFISSLESETDHSSCQFMSLYASAVFFPEIFFYCLCPREHFSIAVSQNMIFQWKSAHPSNQCFFWYYPLLILVFKKLCWLHYSMLLVRCRKHRRRIKTEEKAKVVAVRWGTFLNAALTL